MAAKTKNQDQDVGLSGSKLKKLKITNFRCIGSEGVSIELDKIVVLVGANNVGKSTILRAYEYVMDHKNITKEDFPGGEFNKDKQPEVELETWLGEEKPGEEWHLSDVSTNNLYIRERWTWGEDLKPVRCGYKAASGWDEKVPWGAPNVAKSRRPKPHRVSAFAPPQEQADQVAKLLLQWIKERAALTSIDENGKDNSAFGKIKRVYDEVHTQVVEETKEQLELAESAISDVISKVFKGYKVKFDVSTSDKSDKILELLLSSPSLRMGPEDGFMANVEDQGSGAQRTMLWAALKLLAEQKPSKPSKATSKKSPDSSEADAIRPNVLLIDEPEICLHPSAVREACETLYELAEGDSDWQIMITTHSPIFIDLSKDNTTIVRVERNEKGTINGTTIFRPSKAGLTDDDQQQLKLLNLWDPYVAEFFFGGKTILVEGDTEYSAFKAITNDDHGKYHNVHVVRARGKAILVPLIKILNHFGKPFAVLHDADLPEANTNTGKRINAMWTMNSRIKDAILESKESAINIRHVTSIKDFEAALFGSEAKKEKPYAAWKQISNSPEMRNKCTQLLDHLLGDVTASLPDNFIAWEKEEDLRTAVAKYILI